MSDAHAPPARERAARDARGPSRGRMLANLVVFEAAWFACILGVAHRQPAWGTAAIVVSIAWHVAVSDRLDGVTLRSDHA